MRPVLLTSAFLPPIQYFARLYAAPTIYMERHDHYVKQTYRNRCHIAGPDGVQTLTIPIVHDATVRQTTGSVRLSDHGDWRRLHWQALTSAYDNSPFFEEYAADLRPIYDAGYEYLSDFNDALCGQICRLLGLTPTIIPTTSYADAAALGADDLREAIRPKRPWQDDAAFRAVPYYQVFAARTGFLPNLSIIDLLFNMGPEARLILRESIMA